MYDATIGLDKGDSIALKSAGGSLFVWNENGRVSVSVNVDGDDTLQVYFDDETMEVEAVTSPSERIAVPVTSWQDALRSLCDRLRNDSATKGNP